MLDVSFSKFPRRTGISFSEGLRKIISRTKATGLPNLGDALFRIQHGAGGKASKHLIGRTRSYPERVPGTPASVPSFP